MGSHINQPRVTGSTKPKDRVTSAPGASGMWAKGGPKGQTADMSGHMCSAKEMAAPGPMPKKM